MKYDGRAVLFAVAELLVTLARHMLKSGLTYTRNVSHTHSRTIA